MYYKAITPIEHSLKKNKKQTTQKLGHCSEANLHPEGYLKRQYMLVVTVASDSNNGIMIKA